MDKITTLGIDLAKRVFALQGVNDAGRVVFRRTVRREQLLAGRRNDGWRHLPHDYFAIRDPANAVNTPRPINTPPVR